MRATDETLATVPSEATVRGGPFAGLSTDYASARSELLRRGLTIAPDAVKAPHPRFPELDCDDGSEACRALFLESGPALGHYQTAAEGWRYYVVVETVGATPRVARIDHATSVEDLPPVPPPRSADIPKLAETYWRARGQLLRLGFRPARASESPFSVCAREMEAGKYLDCDDDTELPEVEACAGTGQGFCNTYWIAPDGRTLRVTTRGEPQPGSIYFAAWADADELRGLPAGWDKLR